MFTLHDSRLSGNAWKIRILLTQLWLPFRRITHVLADNTTRTPEFLALNPAGKIPVLILPSGEALAESNAILWYLAAGTAYQTEGMDQQRTAQWLFFEQSEVAKAFSSARFFTSIVPKLEEKAKELVAWRAQGSYALRILERHLRSRAFMVADRYTIADLSLFAYVSMAEEGGIGLSDFGSVREWIERVRAQPGWVPLVQDGAI